MNYRNITKKFIDVYFCIGIPTGSLFTGHHFMKQEAKNPNSHPIKIVISGLVGAFIGAGFCIILPFYPLYYNACRIAKKEENMK